MSVNVGGSGICCLRFMSPKIISTDFAVFSLKLFSGSTLLYMVKLGYPGLNDAGRNYQIGIVSVLIHQVTGRNN